MSIKPIVHSESDQDCGRDASNPLAIPVRGWKQVLIRTKNQIESDHVTIVAAGVAFFSFLAIFPALAALVSLYGLWADPATVELHFAKLASVIPGEARAILTESLKSFSASSDQTLGWGAALSLILALWSAKKGTSGLIEGIGIAYNEKDQRGFIKRTLISLVFTLGAVVAVIISIPLVVLLPAALDKLGLSPLAQLSVHLLRWVVLTCLVLAGLAVLYRFAPDRKHAKWSWVSAGSILASILWLAASGAFSFYASNFGSYDKTYGSIAAVIILMMWLFLSATIVLIGAELNGQLEFQTKRDTTVGAPKPMGSREAYYADHLSG